jgi:ribose transport system substrate-binding protein
MMPRKSSFIGFCIVIMMLATTIASCGTAATSTLAPTTPPAAQVSTTAPSTQAPTVGDIIAQHSTDLLTNASMVTPSGVIVDTSGFKKDPPYTIALLKFASANTFLAQMEYEAIDEASRYPEIVKFIVESADGDANKQATQIEDMVALGVDAIILNPVDTDTDVAAVEKAYAAGIPVVLIANKVNTDKYVSLVQGNDIQFGKIPGDFLMNALGCKGKIIVLNGLTGNSTSDARRQGLTEAIKACPDGGVNVTILAEKDALWAYDQGKQVTEQMLAAYPQIDGVWSQGGAMTQGAIDAFEAANRPLVPMTGEDNNGFLLAWSQRISKGFKAIGVTFPTWQSRIGLQAALEALQGNPVDHFYGMAVQTITADNLSTYVRPEYTDAYWCSSLLPKAVADELFLRNK